MSAFDPKQTLAVLLERLPSGTCTHLDPDQTAFLRHNLQCGHEQALYFTGWRGADRRLASIVTRTPGSPAAPCLIVTLTGTSGPPPFNGLAGPGTLVRYGDDSNNCDAVLMQFDAGRGTLMRLSQVGVQAALLNAVFLTHIHSDHVEGFSDIAQMRWLFGSKPPKLGVVCTTDQKSPFGFIVSCSKLVAHIDDAYHQSGETAQRASEEKGLSVAGPVTLMNVITFEPKDNAQLVWTSGDVKVSAIRSTHIPGHASYRVDTPTGSVVIGGDAANDVLQNIDVRTGRETG
jgi:ribonuclease Z